MKSSAMSASILVASLLFATNGEASEARGAEFRTMSACLSGIKKSSGQKLRIITDKPHLVSGVLSDGNFFGCEKKESGTKGTYIEGWYMVDK